MKPLRFPVLAASALAAIAALTVAPLLSAAESGTQPGTQPGTQSSAVAIAGRWLTEPRDGIIEITPLPGGKFEGRIVGGNSPGRLDARNPDPALRSRPLRGQLIIKDLAAEGDGQYGGGTIYDPDSGKTYKLKAVLNDNGTLKVRGYIGFALLGRSQLWTRYIGTSLDLPAAPRP
ncbi:MAG: DUF2147 domain-containing protein [Steroidobacteraceae bacterium]